MYHIDRGDKLQIEVGQQFTISRNTPNPTLQSCLFQLKHLPQGENSAVILDWISSFNHDEGFRLQILFDQWSLDRLKKHFPPEIVKLYQKFRIEMTYEFIRRRHFPGKISRYEALFVTEDNLDEWLAYLRIREQDPLVYKLQSDNVEQEKVDTMWTDKSFHCVHLGQEFDQVCEHANNYWSNRFTEAPLIESLCVGTFTVIDKNNYSRIAIQQSDIQV